MGPESTGAEIELESSALFDENDDGDDDDDPDSVGRLCRSRLRHQAKTRRFSGLIFRSS